MLALVLRLQSESPVAVNSRQLHGLACQLFERNTEHGAQSKPFAVWPLNPDPMDPEKGVILRCAWLRDTPLPFAADTLATVRLGAHPFSVTAVEWTEETFDSLARGSALSRADLTFRSPVFFAANGRRMVTPDPRLILGSYRRRWNEALGESSPYRIEDDVWMATHRAAELHAFDLRTVKRDGGHGHHVSGFVGTVTLQVTSEEAKETFGTLLRFAPYCGTGARTTYGFGATTVTFPRERDG